MYVGEREGVLTRSLIRKHTHTQRENELIDDTRITVVQQNSSVISRVENVRETTPLPPPSLLCVDLSEVA